MRYEERALDTLVDQVALASKEEGTLYVDRKVVIEGVEARLAEEERDREIERLYRRRIAEIETDRYFNRRKPRPSSQETFYHPELWLPLGDGKRVQLCDAGSADLITYGRAINRNFERVRAARDLTIAWVESRNEALKANPGRRLDWVERNVFGWCPPSDEDFDVPEEPDELL